MDACYNRPNEAEGGVHMTLIQMRYFAEVCHWQNITKAAEQLHVSQPTISVALRALEEETELQLFQREGRKLMLTSDGGRLLGKVTHILEQMRQLEEDVHAMAHHRNLIRMALPLQLGTQFLPKILGEFHHLHPELELDIIESGGISALQMIEEEKLDIALTNYETGSNPKLDYEQLSTCEICFVTYPEHPLAGRESVSCEDLAEEPLVMLDSSFLVYQEIHELYARHNKQPRVMHYSPYLHTIKNLVRHQLGSTFLARPAILPDDHLAVVSLTEPILLKSGIITKKGRPLYADDKVLIHYLQDITRKL